MSVFGASAGDGKMNSKYLSSFVVSLVFLCFSKAILASPFLYSHLKFRFHPNENQFNGFENKVWNATGPVPSVLGINAKYHMKYKGQCSPGANCTGGNCFVKHVSLQSFVQGMVGIGNATRWAPVCPTTGVEGISFAAYSKNPSSGYRGIGLWTDTRDSMNGFVPRDNQRSEIYIGFPTSAVPSETMKPFGAACPWWWDAG